MKVFTVGLDQKPPVEKSESPPPGYASGTATPLPMGPEIAPIIVRKSRGYKGILMVMLAVFLMAIFALTLSEIAYNRQRDENFFRLQWAQLKHRMGYEYPHRIIPVNRGGADFAEIQSLQQQDKKPEIEQSIEQQAPKNMPEPASNSQDSSASSSSSEQPTFADNLRDARLQFLRQILQRIKQNAEQMGFDGTMQVSVIEVEPQQMEFGKKPPSEDPRSDSFLDSFGEFHAPPPFGVNAPPPPPMREINENSIVPQQQQSGRWPQVDFGAFEVPMAFQQQFRPEPMAFRPPEWSFQQGQEGGHEWAPRHENNEFGSGPSPSQEVMGEIYGRKFGRMLQDLIAARIQNSLMQQQQAQQQQQPMNMVMPMRPSFPIEQQANQPVVQPPQLPQMPMQQQVQENNQMEKPQEQQIGQQQVNQQPMNVEQFGQGFPQPQFPVFVSPENRIQIEPPNNAWQQPQQQQSQSSEEKQPQMPPHAILDFMPPRGWTHQSESAPVPVPSLAAPLIDNDVAISPPAQQPQQPVDEPQVSEAGHENRIVILKKQPVDGEKHEEFGSSQLSDLPLKELQGQLAAAAAALNAQQQQDSMQMEQQRFDEEAKAKNMEMQRPMPQDASLFKSIEQSEIEATQQAGQEPPMIEIPEDEPKQQPVEPAPQTIEHNEHNAAEDASEQSVDFPAVKFPNTAAPQQQQSQADAPQEDQHQKSGIFFQVDEPHQQQNVAGFA